MAERPVNSSDEMRRLRPEMSSRRMQVLAFVRDYIARWGGSPSISEIAHGVGITRSYAARLVRKLVNSGQLLRTPGPRGLALPAHRDEAVRQLRELGWKIDEDLHLITHQGTNWTLLNAPPLTYPPRHGKTGHRRRRGKAAQRLGETSS